MNIRHPNRNCNDFPTASEATERASESDRLWFEAHPNQNHRLRPIIDGEFGRVHHKIKENFVAVEQIRPGYRIRRPIDITVFFASSESDENDLCSGDC